MREKEREREREREVLIGKTYIQQIRDESLQNTCEVFECYFVVCDETKQKKKKFFSSKEEQFRHHFFLFFFFSRNVLKFAKINVGGWKQDTHDTYIKDLKPIKEAMIYVTATTVVVVC